MYFAYLFQYISIFSIYETLDTYLTSLRTEVHRLKIKIVVAERSTEQRERGDEVIGHCSYGSRFRIQMGV